MYIRASSGFMFQVPGVNQEGGGGGGGRGGESKTKLGAFIVFVGVFLWFVFLGGWSFNFHQKSDGWRILTD